MCIIARKKTPQRLKGPAVSSTKTITKTVGLLGTGNVYLDGCSSNFFITNTIFITKPLLVLVGTIITI